MCTKGHNCFSGKVVQVHAYSILLEYSEAICDETRMVVICQIRIEKKLQIVSGGVNMFLFWRFKNAVLGKTATGCMHKHTAGGRSVFLCFQGAFHTITLAFDHNGLGVMQQTIK